MAAIQTPMRFFLRLLCAVLEITVLVVLGIYLKIKVPNKAIN